ITFEYNLCFTDRLTGYALSDTNALDKMTKKRGMTTNAAGLIIGCSCDDKLLREFNLTMRF
ncbi:MAG: hypothetical protein DRP78_03840, partial [Candidatus Omnitrophota bacterium]